MNARHANAGFSLIEVMCAILILGIALVGLTQGITTALGSNKESELQTTAALYAAGLVETLRADGMLTDGEKEGECGEDLSLYKWKQTISSTDIEGLHDVEVEVQLAKSSQPIYTLRTMLFEPPSSLTSQQQTTGAKKRGGQKP
jgi:type IV pilus modification protein PilV